MQLIRVSPALGSRLRSSLVRFLYPSCALFILASLQREMRSFFYFVIWTQCRVTAELTGRRVSLQTGRDRIVVLESPIFSPGCDQPLTAWVISAPRSSLKA